jgi:hypothetical protein
MFATQAPRRLTLWRSLALAALLALAGCSPTATTSGGNRATATPQPTATSAPHVLYQADWTHRASEWTLPPHWSIVNGALQNDGDSSSVIALQIPYQVTAQNYTLSMQIRAIATKGAGVSNMYGVRGESPSGAYLFTGAATDIQPSLHSYAIVYPATPNPNGVSVGTYDLTPGRSARPYAWQVDGKFVSFIVSGSRIGGEVESAVPLTPARLVFLDQSVQLVIESLTITAP